MNQTIKSSVNCKVYSNRKKIQKKIKNNFKKISGVNFTLYTFG